MRFIRRTIGGIVVLIGLILIIPSIALFVLSDRIYGSPIVEPNKSLAIDGNVTIFEIKGIFKAGNNYDLKLQYVVTPNPSDPPNSTIVIVMNASSTPSFMGEKIGSDIYEDLTPFNQTTDVIFKTYEFKDDFAENLDLILTFNVTHALNIVGVKVTLKIYENPNREMADLVAKIGLILLIPGIIVIIIGACIAGPSNRRGGGGSRSSPSSGRRTVFR
jgi:hypothetical protein